MTRPDLYLLDTNIVSYIAAGRSHAARLLLDGTSRYSRIGISAITEAEIRYGLARRPDAHKLWSITSTVLAKLEVFAWDSNAAQAYATLKTKMSSSGKSLSALDALIAAHAIALDAILVTNDKAFHQIKALRPPVNWATDL